MVVGAESCSKHDTALHLVLYGRQCISYQSQSPPGETFYHEFMFNHLVYLLTLELFQSSWATFWAEPSATMPSGLVNSTIMVVVFYKILARRLVKWLKFAIKSTWKTRWLLLYNNDPPEDFGLIFSERLAEVAIELILPSGGRECEV